MLHVAVCVCGAACVCYRLCRVCVVCCGVRVVFVLFFLRIVVCVCFVSRRCVCVHGCVCVCVEYVGCGMCCCVLSCVELFDAGVLVC